ncbi:MAG: hypothetical protein ABW095_15515 [Candidatus Thiodiazotropha sp.]
MSHNPTLQTLILSLVSMILICLTIASFGGLIEYPILVHFWYLALYGILAMGLLTLWLGGLWIVQRMSRFWHHPPIRGNHSDSEPGLS